MFIRSLQYRIAALFVGLLVLVMALILVLVSRSNERTIAAEMEQGLSTGAHVFTRLVEQNRRQLEITAAVLSADFGFREAVATQDRPTIRSVLSNHGLRIGAQVMMVIDAGGQLIASVQPSGSAPDASPFPDMLAIAGAQGKSSDFKQLKDGRLYQIVLVPVLAPKFIAWVAMGFLVDDKWARDLSAITGLSISVIQRDHDSVTLLASSLDGPQRKAVPTGLLPLLRENTSEILSLDGEHYQIRQIPLGHEASVILQRSLEKAEAPFRAMQTTLWTIVLGGIAMFVVGSIIFARRIARPVNHLAEVARRIQDGDYTQPIPRLPPDEIGQLALSFEHMREGIAAREDKILKLAYGDALTGLPNRIFFLEAFERHPKNKPATIAIFNLERFGMINNALGHPIGDRLLHEVGVRLAQFNPGGALAARLWVDEFAFLLEGADEAVVKSFAEALLDTMRAPILLEGQRLDVDGSLGIALYPKDGRDITTLMRRAELAMYSAKRRHAGFAFAADIDSDPPHEQLSLIGEMREALTRQEFVVYYQPKLNLATGKIVGAEALLRWQHPDRGMLSPQNFIPFAEKTGFIREITPWLVESVATQAGHWRSDGLQLELSINISALDLLNPDLVGQMRRLVGLHEIPAGELYLEITESALMAEPELALAHLAELAALGFKLSIDDYGSGQASLAYLKTLPVHELKIDQTFIRSVVNSTKDSAIVRSTIVLCHELGLSVVAEGAETMDILDWLRKSDCDLVQGYAIARPMPAGEIPAWIEAFERKGITG
jgi:diguanylate cyclase (GGDEF)-like protein